VKTGIKYLLQNAHCKTSRIKKNQRNTASENGQNKIQVTDLKDTNMNELPVKESKVV
jgi:hypothetical protein